MLYLLLWILKTKEKNLDVNFYLLSKKINFNGIVSCIRIEIERVSFAFMPNRRGEQRRKVKMFPYYT